MAVDEVDQAFFARPVDEVALDLIGRRLRVSTPRAGEVRAMIVETEAYGDASDLASHAAFRPGGRAAVMAGEPGTVYVYAAYGMYPCFNIVTGPVGTASAVLLRGVWRDCDPAPVHGPGRSTRLLAIDQDDHGLTIPGARFGVSVGREHFAVDRTPRVGISRAVETKWRFVVAVGR